MQKENLSPNTAAALGALLLDVAAAAMRAGASTERIRASIHRIAGSFQYQAEVLITHHAVLLSMLDGEGQYLFTSMKRTGAFHVNFKVVSGISRMSWALVEVPWSLAQIRQELERLLALPHYPAVIMLPVVGLSGAAFCRLSGGSITDMAIVFAATIAGLLVRQLFIRHQFSAYLTIYVAAFTASALAALPVLLGLQENHHYALATSVLFLIPGVPLINSFTDLIDGHLQNAILRGVHGLVIALAIALGLLTTLFIYQM